MKIITPRITAFSKVSLGEIFHKLDKAFVISFLFLLSSGTFAGEKPTAYNSLVFPSDIKNYPLLFVSEINGEENLYNFTLENFIERQKRKRNIDHKLIRLDSLKHYPIERYKYVVIPTKVNVTTFSPGSTNYSQVVSYFFRDRVNNFEYRIFATASARSKKDIDESYPMRFLRPAATKNFPKELERILADQERHDPEKQNSIEFRKQQSSRTFFYVLVGLFTVAGPVIGGIVG